MLTTLTTGKFHVFTAEGQSRLPIWEKEPGVFVTIEGEDPTEFLRESLKSLDDYIFERETLTARNRSLRKFLDDVMKQEDMSNPHIKEQRDEATREKYGDGVSFDDKLKELDAILLKQEGWLKELRDTRVGFIEFMAMCKVSPVENDTSEAEASSLIEKLKGAAPKS